MEEEWRVIPGFPGYEVSNMGRVRCVRFSKTRMMTIRTNDKWGYQRTSLRNPEHKSMTPYVHRLVLQAFVGEAPPGHECRHLDSNPRNNRLDNLAWGTVSQNRLDKRANGTSAAWNSKITQCKHGHPFDAENTIWRSNPDGSRRRDCRECKKDAYWSRGPCEFPGCTTKRRTAGLCARHLRMRTGDAAVVRKSDTLNAE